MITRLEKQDLAEQITMAYEDLESLLMRNIIRHIKAYDQPIDSDDWLLEMMGQLGRLNQENLRETPYSPKQSSGCSGQRQTWHYPGWNQGLTNWSGKGSLKRPCRPNGANIWKMLSRQFLHRPRTP